MYASNASFSRAKKRAENALPTSPKKRAAVVERLASDILKVKLPGVQTLASAAALSDETVATVRSFYLCVSCITWEK